MLLRLESADPSFTNEWWHGRGDTYQPLETAVTRSEIPR